MALEGSLAEVSLADICQLLAMGRKSGCLTVRDQGSFGYVYFEAGRVIHATVLNRPDRLGDLVVAGQLLEPGQLARVEAERGDRTLAQALSESEWVEADQLEPLLAMQVEEAIYHLFSWANGSFHFDPDQPLDPKMPRVSMNAEGLLLEGARRVDEWGQIQKKIPSPDLIFGMVENPPDEVETELTKDQKKVMSLLDGERTVDDLVKASGLLEFDTSKALFGLLVAGFIERVGTRVNETEHVPSEPEARQHLKLARAFFKAGMFEDAERELERSVDAWPSFGVARRILGALLLRQRRFEAALEHFSHVTESEDRTYAFHRNHVVALEMSTRFDEALAALDEAEEAFPGDAHLALARGVCQLRAGAPGPAKAELELYRARLGSETPSAVFYAYAVLAHAADGDADRALEMSREGLREYPQSGPLLVNTGALLRRLGEDDAANAYFLRALKSRPALPQAHRALGDMAFERGDLPGARAHYERATKLDPDLGDEVYVRLGEVANREEDPGYAQLLWRRALELNPGNKVARAKLEKLSVVLASS
ncbi:MAG: DUF4388 domain-containing protein [Gemmatimonadota bacterium]|nr:DUF4388 domain-containing protein [Gemmatimonadota bacterium]